MYKGFYSFTNGNRLLFTCCARSPQEAKTKYDEYFSQVKKGERKLEKFSLTDRIAGETVEEYQARRRSLCDTLGNGANRAMVRAERKRIRKTLKTLNKFRVVTGKEEVCQKNKPQ